MEVERPLSGTTIGGYRVGRLLGEGGMGAVYLATDAAGAEVVLKLIHPRFVGHTSAAARFAREASVTTALTHQAIVRVIASDIEGAQPFIAMQYVEGRPLGKVIEAEAPLGLARTSELIQQLLSAMAYAHAQGIVHRDLKPANVMVTVEPDGSETVKVLDFGIAGLFDEARHTRLTQTGQILGTPGYLSPEQAQGEPVDGRADLWAIGVMLYAMLAKRLPFPGKVAADRIIAMLTEPPVPIGEFRPDLPVAFVSVLDRMLTKDPAGRYQTAVEAALAIAESVRTVGAEASPRARAPSPIEPPPPTAPPRAKSLVPDVAPAVGQARSPGDFWGRPAVLMALLGASLVGGGLIAGTLLPGRSLPSEPVNEGTTTRAEITRIEPIAPIAPVDLATDPPQEASPMTASAAPPEGTPAAPALAMSQRAPREPSGDRIRAAEICPHGATLNAYSHARGSTRNSGATLYRAIRPAFFIQQDRGCLEGVRKGTFSVEVTVDEFHAIAEVRFSDPGPLTRQMRRCLRRRMVGLTSYGMLHGPDVATIVDMRLECFDP
ncbi:MAG: hypothetical protein DRJ42_04010 [Deltaproteobacteria bacterium]|nr:MAG: hypothetical protein DRJ42_04010 [Deltaproteobacteria bacterium]